MVCSGGQKVRLRAAAWSAPGRVPPPNLPPPPPSPLLLERGHALTISAKPSDPPESPLRASACGVRASAERLGDRDTVQSTALGFTVLWLPGVDPGFCPGLGAPAQGPGGRHCSELLTHTLRCLLESPGPRRRRGGSELPLELSWSHHTASMAGLLLGREAPPLHCLRGVQGRCTCPPTEQSPLLGTLEAKTSGASHPHRSCSRKQEPIFTPVECN